VKRPSATSFIEKAEAVHCNGYDYSLASYVNRRTDIVVIFPGASVGNFGSWPEVKFAGPQFCEREKANRFTSLFTGVAISRRLLSIIDADIDDCIQIAENLGG